MICSSTHTFSSMGIFCKLLENESRKGRNLKSLSVVWSLVLLSLKCVLVFIACHLFLLSVVWSLVLLSLKCVLVFIACHLFLLSVVWSLVLLSLKCVLVFIACQL